MYLSDYGYATSGGTSMDRYSCLYKELFNWNDNSYSDCYNNDWLYNSSNWEWTISPSAHSWYANMVFAVRDIGKIGTTAAALDGLVYPSVYLKSSTTILGGEGTLQNPYEIG